MLFIGDYLFMIACIVNVVQRGISFAIETRLIPAKVESDSLNVVNLINRKICYRCEVGWVFDEIANILNPWNCFEVVHVPRSCNSAAHFLVKLTLCNDEEQVRMEEYPSEIHEYVTKDKMF